MDDLTPGQLSAASDFDANRRPRLRTMREVYEARSRCPDRDDGPLFTRAPVAPTKQET